MTSVQPLSPARSPVDVSTPAPVDAADADDGAPLLPPPTAGFFDGAIANLAMLLTEADEQDRRDSKAIESAADQAAMADAQQHAQDLRDKASAEETAGVLEGAGMMAGGLAALGAALTAPTPASTPAASTSATSSSTVLHALLTGAQPILEGLGKIGSGIFTGVAGGADADAAWKQAEAETQDHRFNSANQDDQAAAAAIQRVEQWLGTVQQTESATRLTAAGRA